MNTHSELEHRNAEHHDVIAEQSCQNAETFRTYLTWSQDPAVRAWAEAKARACEDDAAAESALAAAIRAAKVPA